MNYITCFTGHRPEAFPWGADKDNPKCKILFNRLEDAIDDLIAKGCTHFIAGNALGIDTWASQIVLEKKKTNLNLILEIAQPYEGTTPAARKSKPSSKKPTLCILFLQKNAATTPTSTATSTWLTKAILSLPSSMIPTLTPAAPGTPWTTQCEKAKSSLRFNGGI